MKLIVLIFAFLIASCASPINSYGKGVRVIKNPEFVQSCKFIGVVEESHYSGWNPEDNKVSALNIARNEAGKMGGDTLNVVAELFRGMWDPLESTCRHASLSIL